MKEKFMEMMQALPAELGRYRKWAWLGAALLAIACVMVVATGVGLNDPARWIRLPF